MRTSNAFMVTPECRDRESSGDHQLSGATEPAEPLSRRDGRASGAVDGYDVYPAELDGRTRPPRSDQATCGGRGKRLRGVRSPKDSGVMSIWNSRPSILARRDKVASDGSWSPASSRAIAG